MFRGLLTIFRPFAEKSVEAQGDDVDYEDEYSFFFHEVLSDESRGTLDVVS